MTSKRLLLPLLLIACAGSAPAETFTTISPETMMETLRGLRSKVQMSESGGDTRLRGRVDGYQYAVYFYECDGGDISSTANPDSECTNYEFRATFTGYDMDAEAANEWNRTKHFGKAWYRRDGQMDLQINGFVAGGATSESIEFMFNKWRGVLADFAQFAESY